MPPTEEVIDKAGETLETIRLQSFTVEQASQLPGTDVVLTWEATRPTGPVANSVVFKIQGVKVQRTGTRTIQPVRPISVALSAEAFGLRRTLGSVAIDIDLSGCFVNSIPDSELATRFHDDLHEEYPQDDGKKVKLDNLPDLTVRIDRTHLRVDAGGMRVSADFDVEIDNAPDGTLQFEALVALGAENGRAVHEILKFSADFDFSGPIDLSIGLSKLAAAIVERFAQADLKRSLDRSLREILTDLSGQIPGACALLTLSPATRRVDFTLCPKEEGAICRPTLLQLVAPA